MFYCDDCATKNKWPGFYGMPQSRGPCEVCGKIRACYDAPVRWLDDLDAGKRRTASASQPTT